VKTNSYDDIDEDDEIVEIHHATTTDDVAPVDLAPAPVAPVLLQLLVSFLSSLASSLFSNAGMSLSQTPLFHYHESEL
jgi:hypothetical protein